VKDEKDICTTGIKDSWRITRGSYRLGRNIVIGRIIPQIRNGSPADALTAPRVQRHEMQTWNEEDLKIFLDAARETDYYPIFYLALFTGMRRSEMLALRWADIDFIYAQISVSRSLHHLRSGETIFRQPKSAKGSRTIALPPSTVLALKKYHKKQPILHLVVGKSLTDEDLVFSHIDGKPLLPDTITHAWIKLVHKTGLKNIRLHDARHTHASLMLKQGIHPKVVQERLGHSSIQITLDTYSHVAPGLQDAAAKRFDEILSNNNIINFSPISGKSPIGGV
jgi:integrase